MQIKSHAEVPNLGSQIKGLVKPHGNRHLVSKSETL